MSERALVDRLAEAVEGVPGWTPLDQLLALHHIAYASSQLGGDILEVGSWCGRSAIALGMAAERCGDTKVYCIDLFPEKNDWSQNQDGTYSLNVTAEGEEYGAYQNQTVWKEPFERDILPVYERFKGTLDAFNHYVMSSGVGCVVEPFRGNFRAFCNSRPSDLAFRLAFIDGDHSYEAVAADIRCIEQYLIAGGWLCFDDAFTSYTGVDQAITELVIQSGRYDCFQQLTRKLFVARKVGRG